jgi:hypothetical protein
MMTLCPRSKEFLKKNCTLVFSLGVIEYSVSVEGGSANHTTVSVSLLDRDGNYVIRDVVGHQENLKVPQARLWWPYLMDPEPAYLYTLEVRKINIQNFAGISFRLTCFIALPLCAVSFTMIILSDLRPY